jgi:hypothetical protein
MARHQAASQFQNSYEERPKSISPNTVLYQQLLKLLSNNSNAPQMSEAEINCLLAKPKIREQLKQLHTQLLQNPDLYLPQLEQVILARTATKLQSDMPTEQEQKRANTINFSSNFKRKPSSLSRKPLVANEPTANKSNQDIANELINLKAYYLKNNNSDLQLTSDTHSEMLDKKISYDSFINSF